MGAARQPMAARLEHRAFGQPCFTWPHSRQLSYACGGDDIPASQNCPPSGSFACNLATHRAWRWAPLSWSRYFRNFPGQGQLPVADFLRAVFAAGYRGPLSLEVFNDEFRAAPARMIARDGLARCCW